MSQMTYFSVGLGHLPGYHVCRVTVAAACQQISFALDKLPATTRVHDTACSVGGDCDGDLTAVVGTCGEFVAHAKLALSVCVRSVP